MGWVREPVVADADRLGEIHVAAWQAAYRGFMPDAYLDGLSAAERADHWRTGLSQDPRPGSVRLVAVDGADVPVGFLFGGPAGGDAGVTDGEVYVVNVHPEYWGTGAGSSLLRTAQDDLATRGFSTAVLWVLAGNRRARSFYERHGWQAAGEARTVEVFGVTVDEVRYRRDL